MPNDQHSKGISMDTIHPRPTEDEAAAVLAAIAAYLQDQASHQTTPAIDWHWSASTRLIAQGLQPIRSPLRPTWGCIERLRRAGSGSSGITGL